MTLYISKGVGRKQWTNKLEVRIGIKISLKIAILTKFDEIDACDMDRQFLVRVFFELYWVFSQVLNMINLDLFIHCFLPSPLTNSLSPRLLLFYEELSSKLKPRHLFLGVVLQ